jgi:hypothetical protein
MGTTSPFPELNAPASAPPSADDPFNLKAYVAPDSTTTLVAPPPEVVAVLEILAKIRAKTKALLELAEHRDEGTEQLVRVRGAIRSLSVIAAMMEQRRHFDSTADPKCEGFESTTKNLVEKFFKAPAFATAIDIRAIDRPLSQAISTTKTELLDLLRAPANVAVFKKWAANVDWSGDWKKPAADGKLSGVGFAADLLLAVSPVLRETISALAKFESEADLAGMTESVAAAAEAKQGEGSEDTVFHVEANSAAAIFQKVAAGSAGMALQVVGPDGAFLRLLEVYALKYLPTAAVSKPDAARLRGFLLKNFLKAIGATEKEKTAFSKLYVKVASAQIEVRWRKTALERVDPRNDAARASAVTKLSAAENELHEAEESLSKRFLEDPNELIEEAHAQATPAWKSGMAILAAIQLYDAFSDFDEVKNTVDAAKLLSDMAGAGLQIATLSFDVTVGLFEKAGASKRVNLKLARWALEHFHLKYEAAALSKIAPTGVAALAAISGVLQFYQGLRDNDYGLMAEGGLQAVAGGFQVYAFRGAPSLFARVGAMVVETGAEAAAGEAVAGTVATVLVIADIACMLPFAIGIGAILWEAAKPGSQVVSEAIVKYLETQAWGYGPPQNFVKALGLPLEDVKNMMGALNFFKIPLDPSADNDRLLERKMLVEMLKAGGLSDDMADNCLESAGT